MMPLVVLCQFWRRECALTTSATSASAAQLPPVSFLYAATPISHPNSLLVETLSQPPPLPPSFPMRAPPLSPSLVPHTSPPSPAPCRPPATSCIMVAPTGHGLVLAPQATFLPMSAALPPGLPPPHWQTSLGHCLLQAAAPRRRSPQLRVAPYTLTLIHLKSPPQARQARFS